MPMMQNKEVRAKTSSITISTQTIQLNVLV